MRFAAGKMAAAGIFDGVDYIYDQKFSAVQQENSRPFHASHLLQNGKSKVYLNTKKPGYFFK